MQALALPPSAVLRDESPDTKAKPFNRPAADGRDTGSMDSMDTLHRMPLKQIYLRELDFQRMRKDLDIAQIPQADGNRFIVQQLRYDEQANAFGCSTNMTIKTPSNVATTKLEPEHVIRLRELFRQVESRGAAKRRVRSTHLIQSFDAAGECKTFWQWFMSGPTWAPGIRIIVPR